jgi:hypothetical protein
VLLFFVLFGELFLWPQPISHGEHKPVLFSRARTLQRTQFHDSGCHGNQHVTQSLTAKDSYNIGVYCQMRSWCTWRFGSWPWSCSCVVSPLYPDVLSNQQCTGWAVRRSVVELHRRHLRSNCSKSTSHITHEYKPGLMIKIKHKHSQASHAAGLLRQNTTRKQ